MRFDPKDTEKARKNSEIIYEDDYYLFLRCLGRDCFSYYAPHSVYRVWYDYWARRGNELYFAILKNREGGISTVWTILKIENADIKVKEEASDSSFSNLLSDFSELKNKFYEIFATSDLYETLKRISEGFEYDKHNLNRIDDCVVDIKFNKTNPNKSFIRLRFTDEEYLGIFYGGDDNYNISFYNQITSSYDSYEFTDPYNTKEDWGEGYLFRAFNNQNKEKYKKIVQYFSPIAHSKEDYEEIFSETVDRFTSMFQNEVDRIIDDYHTLDNDCRREGTVEAFEGELCELLTGHGIIKVGNCFNTYVTTNRNLISMYEETNSQGFSLLEMLRNFVVKNGLDDPTDFHENYYDYWCSDWSSKVEEFNKDVSRQLDYCLEKIEDSNYFSDIDEYKQIVDVIKTYKMDRWNQVPHSKNQKFPKFKIQDIDPQTNKIKVLVWKGNSIPVEPRSYTLDEFNNFLHSPELFD